WGTELAATSLLQTRRRLGLVAAAVAVLMLGSIAIDRAHYLQENKRWGEANLAAWNRERGEWEAALADVRAILDERPGRVAAGAANGWGHDFKIGDVPIYALLSRAHFDQPSMLYH